MSDDPNTNADLTMSIHADLSAKFSPFSRGYALHPDRGRHYSADLMIITRRYLGWYSLFTRDRDSTSSSGSYVHCGGPRCVFLARTSSSQDLHTATHLGHVWLNLHVTRFTRPHSRLSIHLTIRVKASLKMSDTDINPLPQ